MKNSIIAILIILFLGGGVWYFRNRSADNLPDKQPGTGQATGNVQPDSVDEPGPVFAATITHTENGFSPASVTIRVGDTVKWINQADAQMRVASAPHPTHTAYQGFDQQRSVGKDGEYSFTFTRAGEWRYHDHLNPSHNGTVVVE